MQGYFGRWLRIDLDTGRREPVPLNAADARRTLGGVGLGTWLLLRETRGAYDALAPEAPLVLAFAPLVGTALNTTAKLAVVSKSPLTGRLNDAMLSSRFALAGKAVGADALLLRGACPAWSVLFVEPAGVHREPAGDLQGLGAEAAATRIRERHGAEWAVIAIGVAGEHAVPYATLSHDGRHAGRGGTGAVLGAKRLKAVAVRGDRAPGVADPEALERLRAGLREASLGPGTAKYRTTGTLGNLKVFNRLGVLPTRNFAGGGDARAAGLSAEGFVQEKRVARSTCADCTIGCEKRMRSSGGRTTRLEYENLFALGPMLGLWDADTVLEASRLCDEYGLDTISTGGTLAFAMECAERGWLPDTPLRFGDGAAVLEAIRRIAHAEGEGRLLALGSRALAGHVGHGSLALAPQVKGMELPGYHPARLQSLALGLALGARGADHNKSGAYDLDLSGEVDAAALDEDRVARMVELEDQAALMDSLILCKFVRRALGDFYAEAAAMLGAVTGWRPAPDELRAVARGIHDDKKAFNQRQGWHAGEDTLPERFFRGSPAADPEAGIDPARFAAARRRYYAERGWDAQGRLSEDIPAAAGAEV